MSKNSKPTILIIIGISGDLSKRKLLPAIGEIAKKGMLPEEFKIIGVTRQADIKLENLLDVVSFSLVIISINICEEILVSVVSPYKVCNTLRPVIASFTGWNSIKYFLNAGKVILIWFKLALGLFTGVCGFSYFFVT